MSNHGFCTRCGKALGATDAFCTTCGAATSGAAATTPAKPAVAKEPTPKAASSSMIAVGALLLVAGGAAAFFSMRESTEVPRAVPGSPSVASSAPGGEENLPSGHPSILLPKEVLDFLDELSAAADKDPKSVEAAQTLARARYRASVINASYRTSAEQALAKLMALAPDNVEGQRISANLAYDSGNYPEAQKRFEAFLAKNPKDPAALTDLGSSHLFQEHLDQAVAAYDEALEIDPKFMQAHFNKGIALQKQGKKDEAKTSLHSALDAATAPEEKQHIENALAELEGRAPAVLAKPDAPAGHAHPEVGGAATGGASQGGMAMPPPAPDRPVKTNATTEVQRQAEKPLVTHSMIGPRLQSFDWTSPTTVRALIADFPMDQMPPFALAKFRQGMADKVLAATADQGGGETITVELVDNASGRVMDTIVADPKAAAPGSPQ